MKRIFILLIALTLAFSLIGCSKHSNETVFDAIKLSPAAKIELPDGSSAYVDSEIDSIRSFADLELMEASLKPADNESDWLYRIIFNPSEKVKNTDEIIVSFHEKYIQINSEYYLTAEGVPFDGVLEWAESKFDYFIDSSSLNDLKPMIMIDGKLYLDTGVEEKITVAPEDIEGEILSSVPQTEKPSENGQSNFGAVGNPYYIDGDNLIVQINDKWFKFEQDNAD